MGFAGALQSSLVAHSVQVPLVVHTGIAGSRVAQAEAPAPAQPTHVPA
jgi:hypothetical protein